MKVLWADPQVEFTARDVVGGLPEYAYTTVATVLGRLARKGEVHRTRAGSVVRYRATGSPAAHASKAMNEALDAAPDAEEVFAAFVASMRPEQRRTLRRLLDDDGDHAGPSAT